MTVPTKRWKRSYYFVSGMLYPSALGMAFTWFVAAAYNITMGTHRPGLWAILFALWFTVYHSMQFVRLVDPDSNWAKKYGGWSLSSDILDALALFVAFAALGFQADSDPTSMRVIVIFGAALAIAYSAMVAHATIERERWFWIGLAAFFSVAGMFLNANKNPEANGFLLLGLWLVLFGYATRTYSRE